MIYLSKSVFHSAKCSINTSSVTPILFLISSNWSNTEQEHHVESRTALFIKYDETPIAQLEPCSKDERWASDITYACIKKGATKATKLFTEAIAAQQYAEEKGLIIELREANDPRCTEYCSFVKICPYARSKGYDKA